MDPEWHANSATNCFNIIAQTQGEAGQLGGVLIAHGDKVLYKHKEQYAGDHAPLNEILKSIGYDEETANKELALLFPEGQKKNAPQQQ